MEPGELGRLEACSGSRRGWRPRSSLGDQSLESSLRATRATKAKANVCEREVVRRTCVMCRARDQARTGGLDAPCRPSCFGEQRVGTRASPRTTAMRVFSQGVQPPGYHRRRPPSSQCREAPVLRCSRGRCSGATRGGPLSRRGGVESPHARRPFVSALAGSPSVKAGSLLGITSLVSLS